MKMINQRGEAVYYNSVEKNGKLVFIVQGIGNTVIIGRDKQKRKSRTFSQERQAAAYLDRHGFKCV